MYGQNKLNRNYAGTQLPGIYDTMAAPGYLSSTNKEPITQRNNLAHRFWPQPDFSIKKYQF